MHLSRTHRIIAALVATSLLFLLSAPAHAQTGRTEISQSGIGAAELGMTVDELAAALGDDYDVSDEVRITVDFNGHVISRDGSVQFRAAMAGAGPELNLFIVSNTDYATAEGIGPMSTIAAAEAVYGDATLMWNPDNESREFVSFENGPNGRVMFRTPGIGGNNVGIYDDGSLETTEYEDGATIASVWVSCRVGDDCPADVVVMPTATAAPVPPPDPDGGEGGSGGGEGGSGELPRTGLEEIAMVSIVAALFVLGGAALAFERRLGLCPAWLTGRRT